MNLLVDVVEGGGDVVEVGEAGEFAGEEEEEEGGDEGHEDEDAEEIVEAAHFFHEAGEEPAVVEGDADADVPKADEKGGVAGGCKAGDHGEADGGEEHFANRHEEVGRDEVA